MKKVYLIIALFFSISVKSYSQAVVSVPDLTAQFTIFKVNNERHHVEKISKSAEIIVKTAEMLRTLKKSKEKLDSVYYNQIVPLKQNYRFVKDVYENAQLTDLWEASEYVLGESLNPANYMPDAFKDPNIVEYMDNELGWSYRDISTLNRKTGYSNQTNSSVRRLYKALLPSYSEISKNIASVNQENKDKVDKELDYIDNLLKAKNNDTLQFAFLLDKINRLWYQAEQEYKELVILQQKTDEHLKNEQVSIEGYTYLMVRIEKKRERLFAILDELEKAMAELNDKQVANAEDVQNKLNNQLLMEELDLYSTEMRRLNNSGNGNAMEILFGYK